MPLMLAETAIVGKAIRMRYADDDPPTEWIEFQVRLKGIVGTSA
jgi:hypothetical protein